MTGRAAVLRLAVLAAAAAVAAGCRSETPAPPPAAGERLLPAAETAASVVVGEIGALERVDRHGYRAAVEIVRVVRGTGTGGQRLQIAWEELAAGRAPRLQAGDVLLLALQPLPAGSLWDERFPGARGRGDVLVIAAGGDAYLRHPAAGDVDLLHAYLTLPAQEREQPAGVGLLSAMVARASPGLASSALARIESVPRIASRLDPEAADRLQQALLDDSRPLKLRSDLLRVTAAHRIAALRPALDRLAEDSGPLRASALSAIAAIDGGLDPQRVERLLASELPDLRAVGARHARSQALRARLARLVAADPSPQVRAAAADSLMAVAGIDAFDEVVPALAASDAEVRLAAVEAVSRLGEAAVQPLAELLKNGRVEEATGAVLALDQLGAAGKAVLIETAAQHPDERIRRLALLALGRLPGHEH